MVNIYPHTQKKWRSTLLAVMITSQCCCFNEWREHFSSLSLYPFCFNSLMTFLFHSKASLELFQLNNWPHFGMKLLRCEEHINYQGWGNCWGICREIKLQKYSHVESPLILSSFQTRTNIQSDNWIGYPCGALEDSWRINCTICRLHNF